MNGKVYLVGIGPGSPEDITPRAVNTLKEVSVVIGQKACINLVVELLSGKKIIDADLTPVERAEIAVGEAFAGREVAIITTGDPGIYAIASTFFSYIRRKGISVPVKVVPGLAAANIAAALLGAPLGCDYAVISLADMAIPWKKIKRRLCHAADSDLVLVLYNPIGKTGLRRLKEAMAVLMQYRHTGTLVGVVTGAATEMEKFQITSLEKVLKYRIDVQTIIIIGNSETFVYDGRMIARREYVKGVGY